MLNSCYFLAHNFTNRIPSRVRRAGAFVLDKTFSLIVCPVIGLIWKCCMQCWQNRTTHLKCSCRMIQDIGSQTSSERKRLIQHFFIIIRAISSSCEEIWNASSRSTQAICRVVKWNIKYELKYLYCEFNCWIAIKYWIPLAAHFSFFSYTAKLYSRKRTG